MHFFFSSKIISKHMIFFVFAENKKEVTLHFEATQASPYQDIQFYRNYMTRNDVRFKPVIVMNQVTCKTTCPLAPTSLPAIVRKPWSVVYVSPLTVAPCAALGRSPVRGNLADRPPTACRSICN